MKYFEWISLQIRHYLEQARGEILPKIEFFFFKNPNKIFFREKISIKCVSTNLSKSKAHASYMQKLCLKFLERFQYIDDGDISESRPNQSNQNKSAMFYRDQQAVTEENLFYFLEIFSGKRLEPHRKKNYDESEEDFTVLWETKIRQRFLNRMAAKKFKSEINHNYNKIVWTFERMLCRRSRFGFFQIIGFVGL